MSTGRWTAVMVVAICALGAAAGVQYARTHGSAAPASVTATARDARIDKISVRLFREPVQVPTFTMTDITGRPLSSSDWKGKVVLVNFWATWCGPCRAEIPELIALQNKYRDKLVIVGISEDDGPIDNVKRFVADQKMNYPVVMETPELSKIFRGVVALPTTFVIDRDGRLEQKHVGELSADDTEAEARVLAGLNANASVERIDSSDKARLERAAQART